MEHSIIRSLLIMYIRIIQVLVQSELCQLSAPQWFDFIQELEQQISLVSVTK